MDTSLQVQETRQRRDDIHEIQFSEEINSSQQLNSTCETNSPQEETFDFDKIQDNPDFDTPKQPCSGIKRVYVNGVLTAEDGVHTGARAGKTLRKGKQVK